MKESKLIVRKSHAGIEFEHGSKMVPSYPLKKVSKVQSRKHKGRFVEGEFEFEAIQISPKGFQKAEVLTTYDPDELSREDHEILADIFAELAHTHHRKSQR